MPWETSRRRKDPANWPQLKALIWQRAGGMCEHISEPDLLSEHGERCTYKGKDVDHIVNVAKGGSDDPSNLQLLCDWHHKQKTAREAAEARKPRTERHPRERHPGWN